MVDVKQLTRAVESFVIKNDIKQVGDKILVTCPFLIANEENLNGRYYLKNALVEGVDLYMEDYIHHSFGNRAIMELEHPPLDNDELYYRVTQINGAAKILDLWWDGDTLMGTYETSTNYPLGNIVIGYHKENVPIGVSVRSGIHIAPDEDKHLYGIDPKDPVEVIDVIRIISWDIVLNPGFDNARRLNVTSIKNANVDAELNNIKTKLGYAVESFKGDQQYEKADSTIKLKGVDAKNVETAKIESTIEDRETKLESLINACVLKYGTK